MTLRTSPTQAEWLRRWLAGTLAALMVVVPSAGQSAGSSSSASVSSAQAGGSAATKAKTTKKSTKPASAGNAATGSAPAGRKPAGQKGAGQKSSGRGQAGGSVARRARTARIHQAFVASTELRPMAQQLATLRTPAAYAGVEKYAHQHQGEAAAAAYLALGHAYLLDKRYTEAEGDFSQARKSGDVLADYAEFLGAEANHEAGNNNAAEGLLRGFVGRYPDSIFAVEAPELEANVLLGMGNAAGAQQVLGQAAGAAASGRSGFLLAQGEVALAQGQTQEAERIFKRVLLSHPLSSDAQIARAKLTAMGTEASLTAAELRSLGDAYYNAGKYELAAEQYRSLARESSLDPAARNGFAVAEAACDLKLKRLSTAQVEALAETKDENGARRQYLLMELARNRNDLDYQKRIVSQMESSFPRSEWLAEALFSSGNMYMLRRDYPTAVGYYSYLATHFPENTNAAAAHWRAGWLSYRQGSFADAARMFDDQIRLYPGAKETVSAIYWRGRLYETQDHKPANAAANYRTLIRAYQHFFYAQMARERLAALGNAKPAAQPQLDSLQAAPVPALQESFPADSPHLAKARLLANAGLNDYIPREISADPNSSSWSALAEAQIYTSYGETYRAMRALKRSLPYAATASIKSIPMVYWRILFPKPWWETIKAESAKNNLDPYLVASLIRQESEFDPSVVSYANAYGLMQLLPSVGRQMAKEEGISHFETFQLLDPAMNIRLGTRYLREMLEKFGGVQIYALAAYNAGDSRVVDWQSAGQYHGMDEFVESIPFTQTRDYVEAILRNEETYRSIDGFAGSQTQNQAPHQTRSGAAVSQ